MSKKVFVGLSGGVDSSVTALLLKEQGYDVVGVYMKNWAQDLPGFNCPWEQDLIDADAVAAQLEIELKVFDFQKEYRSLVVDYMLDGFRQGITPNPDIMCNQEIKFKIFLQTSLEAGADYIATGHYARSEGGRLYKALDAAKDQTYFLYRVTSEALEKSLMPLAELKKTEVRELAKYAGLITAAKKDSVGLCFVGDVSVKDFLKQFVEYMPGPIIDETGREIGQHEGAIFYTIGQRHGLNVGGGLPYYVYDKDMASNTVFVTTHLDDERLWSKELRLSRPHWIKDLPKINETYEIRARHGAKLIKGQITKLDDSEVSVKLETAIKAASPGQSSVIYDKELVLGGGIII